MKYLFLILIGLSGCAITTAEKSEQLSYMAGIEQEFRVFVRDCDLTGGNLVIDKRSIDRRVQVAPITVWEMKDAVCYYDDGTFPRRMEQ